MSTVFFDVGVSFDGFLAGENRGPGNPLGDSGPTIHQWMYQQKGFWKHLGQDGGNEEGPELFERTIRRTGAYVMGKRMFEEGEPNWPEDLYKAPVYVLTHEKRDPWVQRGSTPFYFVNDGIEDALARAREAADGKDVHHTGWWLRFSRVPLRATSATAGRYLPGIGWQADHAKRIRRGRGGRRRSSGSPDL